MKKIPTRTRDGQWSVGGLIFSTNAQAWRFLDRQECEVISPAEERTEFYWQRIRGGQ